MKPTATRLEATRPAHPIANAAQLRRSLTRIALLVAVAVLSACEERIYLDVRPSSLVIRAGDNATVLAPAADPNGGSLSITLDFVPDGVTYSIDNSLHSSSTQGASVITFHVSTATEPGIYDLVVSAQSTFYRAYASLRLFIVTSAPLGNGGMPVAMTVGRGHNLVTLSDGSLWAWGRNANGELGVGDRRDRFDAPTRVPVMTDFETIATPWAARSTAAVDSDGRLWTWGSDTCGLLGNGGTFDRDMPMQVTGLPHMQAVDMSNVFTLALSEDGTAWVWGGSPDLRRPSGFCTSTPVADRRTPRRIEGIDEITQIAAGYEHALMARADGTVWSTGRDEAAWAQVPELDDIVDVAVGEGLFLALADDGSIRSWGRAVANTHDNDSMFHDAPVRVIGLDDVQRIAAADDYWVALRSDGTVWGQGYELRALASSPGGPPATGPFQITDLASVVDIVATADGLMARTACGQIWNVSLTGLLTTFPDFADDGTCHRFALRVDLMGARGEISTDPPTVRDCDQFVRCIGVYERGTTVTLRAFQIDPIDSVAPPHEQGGDIDGFDLYDYGPLWADKAFVGWEGDCQSADPEITIVVNATMRCVAVFRSTAPELFLLTAGPGSNGHVGSSGGGVLGPDAIDCGPAAAICNAIFADGTEVMLTVEPTAGFEFVGWDGDCVGTEPVTRVTIDADKSCEALFSSTVTQFLLSTGVSGLGTGTVTGIGILCPGDCTEAFDAGTEVMLTATPGAGSVFSGWSVVNHPDCAEGPATLTVVMDDDKLCRAVFVEAGPEAGVTIHVSISNFGDSPNNRITSFPEGIDCRSGPDPFENDGICEAHFTDEQVRLFAEPADGDGFNFWSSNCFEEEPLTCLLDNPNDGSTVVVGAAFDPN